MASRIRLPNDVCAVLGAKLGGVGVLLRIFLILLINPST